MKSLTAEHMKKALARLDEIVPKSVTLIIGGGGAMLLAYRFPMATADIDAVAKGLSAEELKPFIEQVARDLGLPSDWLNPWFSSFTHVLPEDFANRLVPVFSGRKLSASALGREDLLLMKCFAHRKKDVPHARALIRAKTDTEFVFARIEELAAKKIPGTTEAEDFLEEIIDLEEG